MPRNRTPFAILFALLFTLPASGHAQQAATAAPPAIVEISTLRNPVTLPYKPFYAAAKNSKSFIISTGSRR